jgi:Co/Zn/Cd efflux system component
MGQRCWWLRFSSSWKRASVLLTPPEVRGGIVSVVASGGLAANLVAGWVLLRWSRQSLNVRGDLGRLLREKYGTPHVTI